MSTEYQMLREPWTSVRVESTPGHDRVTLFEGHADTGTLTLLAGTAAVLLQQLSRNDHPPAMLTSYGGTDKGVIVTEHPSAGALDPSLVLISEYGEPITVAEIRAMAGQP